MNTTTSSTFSMASSSSSWHVAHVPQLFMATASILLECLFRIRRTGRQQQRVPSTTIITTKNNSLTRDRIMVQLLLWLTASLPSSSASNTNNNLAGQPPSDHHDSNDPRGIFDLLLNVLFFTNFLGIVLPQLVQVLLLPGNRHSLSDLGSRRGNNNNNYNSSDSSRATRRGTLLGSMCGGCSRCWGCYGCTNSRNGNQKNTTRVVLFITGKCCQDGLELAPLALWVVLLRAFLLIESSHGNPIDTTGHDQSYFGIAGAVWVGSCCGLWLKRLIDYSYKTRQQHSTLEHGYHGAKQSLPGLHHLSDPSPFTSTSNHSGVTGNHHDGAPVWLDESKWHTWTVSQVMEWLLEHGPPNHYTNNTTATFSQYDTSNYYETQSSFSWGTLFYETIVPRLAWEGVDGVALEFLNLDALRHMDVPYGVAAPLLQQIQARLVQRYPRRREASNDTYNNDRGWTLEDPYHERASHNQQSQQQQEQQSPSLFGSPNKNYSISEPTLEEDQMKQMRTVMKERFGFELPDLASTDPSQASLNGNYNDTGESFARKNNVQHAPKTSVVETTSDDVGSAMCTESDPVPPPSTLALMPPHIREIVLEKPHLWQQVQRQPPSKIVATSATTEETINETAPVYLPVSTPPPVNIAPELLANLPPRVKEVALRNPGVFLQMFQSKQQQKQQQQPQQQGRAGQEGNIVQSKDSFNNSSLAGIAEEELEAENDELAQLLPNQSTSSKNQGLLRQRPGF